MYIIKALAEQNVPYVNNTAINANLRFRLDGIPGGLDVIKMELYACYRLTRATTTQNNGLTIAQQLAAFNSVSMDAYGENIINRLTGVDLYELGMCAGESGFVGTIAAAVSNETFNTSIIVPFYDRRMDERGSAYDTAQDSSLLLQGGTVDINFVLPARNWPTAGNTINVGILLYCMPRTGVYCRPYKRWYKVNAPALRGVRLERGVFTDILFQDNATRTAAGTGTLASGLAADNDSLMSAEYAGVQFKNNLRIRKNQEMEGSALEGVNVALIAVPALQTALEINSLTTVHTMHNELGEISKYRRSPNAEGLLDLVAGGRVVGAPTGGFVLYTEVKPAGREHLLRVAQTYGIPSDQAITVLGPDSDPWMPKQLA